MAVNNVSVEFEASASEAIMTTQNILVGNVGLLENYLTVYKVINGLIRLPNTFEFHSNDDY